MLPLYKKLLGKFAIQPIWGKLIVLAIMSLIFSTTAYGDKRKTITWLVWELSPEFIRYGDYAGKGFADEYLQYFIDKLPEYDHKIQWTGIKRFHVEALKPNRCTPHIWKAFHLDKFKYSKPYMLTPPHIAILHKRFEKELGPAGSILSIETLLGEKKLKLVTPGLFSSQPRYPVLHPYLEKYAGTDRIIELNDGSNEVDLRIIEKGRGDFSLGYVTTITAQKRDRKLSDDFVFYGLQEHQQYKNIHVSCFGDRFGKKVIRKIDEVLDKKTLDHFLMLYEDWNNKDPDFRKSFYKKIVNE